MKTCIIIEDQAPAQRILKKYIQNIESLELIGVFNNVIEADGFMQENNPDLLFLDIHLPNISGIDFLKSLNKSPLVVLTTAFPNYALESYEFKVADYLLKPFSFDRFKKAITKCNSYFSSNLKEQEKFFMCKSGIEIIKVYTNEIHFIEGYGDYTKINRDNDIIISNNSLKKWKDELPDSFIQIHKSFILNFNSFQKVTSNQVVLKNNKQLPLGRSFKKDFLEKINL